MTSSKKAPFSAATKKAAFERAGGKCERCGVELSMASAEFHHRIPQMDGGDASLENCVVLCHYDHAGNEKIFQANHPNSPSRLWIIGKKGWYGRKRKKDE